MAPWNTPGPLSCSTAVADTSWRISHAAAANSSVIERFLAPASTSESRTPRTWSEMTTMRGTARVEPLDGADAAEGLVTEFCEPRRLIAKRLFEGADPAQLATDLEHLQRLVGSADRVQPLAQAVLERHGCDGTRL